MKSEERHDLAQNELAKLFDRWATKIDPYANQILIGVCAVALVAAGVIYWVRTNQVTQAVGWSELMDASSAEEYANVADDFAGTTVEHWARTRASWGNLRDGIRLSISDRAASNERLEEAREGFDKLLASADAPVEAREQSMMGLALTLESQSSGDTEPAITAYENLLREFPETRYAKQAKERIDELKTGESQQFYAWFSKETPSPASRPQPNDGNPFGAAGLGGGGDNPFGLDLDALKKRLDSGDDTAGETPETTDESTTEEKMTDEKMTDESPASDEPADDATPPADDAADAPATPPKDAPADQAKTPADEGAEDQPADTPPADDAAPADDAVEEVLSE